MNRWWVYQKERFPVFKHGVLIAIFGSAAVGYSLLLRNGLAARSVPEIAGSAFIAVVTLFLFFLQLRIADEFKDFEEDRRYRSYRPVPRGLVTLRELAIVGLGSAVIQLGLAIEMGLELVLLLALVWGYLGLMSQEFFVPQWLKAHPVVYLLSHAVIMPLMGLYATACDWLVVRSPAPGGLGWFLGVSLLSGLTIEIGRKIRAPQNEEPGVETYSALWGRPRSVMVWLSVVWLFAVTAILAANQIQFVVPAALVLLLLLTGSLVVAWRFLSHPISAWAEWFELMSGLWTLLVYLAIGVVPVLVRL